jgi:hypothetical protein
MQVTQTNEFITHAVISGTAQIDMGISNSAEFFQILSSTLYSDQLLAVVRETTCNAWDAHVDSKRTDKPIQITVDSSKVVIRDFGRGILHELMGPIYGIYGASTKKNDGLQTGGFGLGCKAPFAYTDHFQVTSYHNGTKTIYSMSKSSAQVGGKPAIIPITSFPTTETGLEVSINIKPDDMPRFLQLFQLIVRNGEMNAEINGELIKTTPYSEAKNGFLIMSHSPMQEKKSGNSICIRYGNVIYPLDGHVGLIGYKNVFNILEKLPPGYYYGNNNNTLVLLAPPHSISVTPSREALSMQEHTITTVNKLMQDFIDYINQKDEHLENTMLKESITKATSEELISFESKLHQHLFNREAWQQSELLITDYKMYRRAVRSHQHIYGLNKKDVLLRIKAADDLKLFARGKAHSLFRTIQQTHKSDLNQQSTWVAQHIVNPLLRKMKLNPELNLARLFFTRYNGCTPVKTKDAPLYLCDWQDTAKHARPYVVIHYVRKEVDYRIQKEGTLNGNDKRNVLFYHVPRVAGKLRAAVDFFTAEGYQVIDLTKPLAGEAPDVVAPVVRMTGGTRQQGLIALSAAAKGGAFDADTLYSEEAKRISTAKCMFLCTNTDGQRGRNVLASFSGMSNVIMNLYGDIAGVAKTQDQYDRYNEKGIKNGVEYVIDDVISYITKSDIILQHMSAKRTLIKHRFTERIYDYVLKSSVACDMFNLPFIIEQKDKTYIELWEYLKRTRRSNAVIAAEQEIDSLPNHQATLDICNKIKNSKYYVFLETGLYITQTEFDEHIADFLNFINQ